MGEKWFLGEKRYRDQTKGEGVLLHQIKVEDTGEVTREEQGLGGTGLGVGQRRNPSL